MIRESSGLKVLKFSVWLGGTGLTNTVLKYSVWLKKTLASLTVLKIWLRETVVDTVLKYSVWLGKIMTFQSYEV